MNPANLQLARVAIEGALAIYSAATGRSKEQSREDIEAALEELRANPPRRADVDVDAMDAAFADASGVVVKVNRVECRFERFAKSNHIMSASGGTFDTHKMLVQWKAGHTSTITKDSTVDLLDVAFVTTLALSQTDG